MFLVITLILLAGDEIRSIFIRGKIDDSLINEGYGIMENSREDYGWPLEYIESDWDDTR